MFCLHEALGHLQESRLKSQVHSFLALSMQTFTRLLNLPETLETDSSPMKQGQTHLVHTVISRVQFWAHISTSTFIRVQGITLQRWFSLNLMQKQRKVPRASKCSTEKEEMESLSLDHRLSLWPFHSFSNLLSKHLSSSFQAALCPEPEGHTKDYYSVPSEVSRFSFCALRRSTVGDACGNSAQPFLNSGYYWVLCFRLCSHMDEK